MLEPLFFHDFEQVNKGQGYTLYKKAASKPSKRSPVLIVFTPFLRAEGLYLNEDHSIVNWFTDDGYDVYLLDWGSEMVSIPSDRYMEDHIHELENAIAHITADEERATVHLIGIWEGALFALMAAMIAPEKVRSLTMIGNILDYERIGYLEENIQYYILPYVYHPLWKIGTRHMNFHHFGFHIMRNLLTQPVYMGLSKLFSIWKNNDFITNYKMALWLNDVREISATTFNEMIEVLYHKNELITKRIYCYDTDGKRHHINIENLNVSIFNVVSTEDQLAPCIGGVIENNLKIKDYMNYWLRVDTFNLIINPQSEEATTLRHQLVNWMSGKDQDGRLFKKKLVES